ncbi:hypothetical protein [Thermoflexibacter ruber]|uniref:Uncharacterized protein n=1 Tax=Thermoflexibacter ruber TaxID=1003 RepID=A0A1I2A720_9BACT|nr:hypothetical protein [Thermoflexibacter ruber]SFE39358.1 hypothetical protein SAMN04488541_100143 [Thermoflexibacter ruber]
MKAKYLFVCVLVLSLISASYVEANVLPPRLKMSRAKVQYWNSSLEKWSGWPTEWSLFQEGNEPVFRITALGNSNPRFWVESWINGRYREFTVRYTDYDAQNDWFKYTVEDGSGDQICVVGSTLSYLSQNGWPSNKVQIYMWIYSASFAIVLE